MCYSINAFQEFNAPVRIKSRRALNPVKRAFLLMNQRSVMYPLNSWYYYLIFPLKLS